MTLSELPAFNAQLNGASAVLLTAGYAFIRSGRVKAHRACMAAAFLLSATFLVSYLYYHAHVGHVRFLGTGPIRPLYFAILISHTSLAILSVPMILRTLYLAGSGRFLEHQRAARWTLPTWLYVSITGVLVYWLLYRLYRPGV